MKFIFSLPFALLFILGMLSCSEAQFNEVNVHPTRVTEIDARNLLSGTMLANTMLQVGHFQHIAGMWSGQYKGLQLFYENTYLYRHTSFDTEYFFNFLYNGVLLQNRKMRQDISGTQDYSYIYQAITRIVEANAVGTATALFGDIPYSEAALSSIASPKYDAQQEVFAQLQKVLDEALIYLDKAKANALPSDLYFGGDIAKWRKVAYTLKARYYWLNRAYQLCLDAAQKGIDSDTATLYYTPKNASSGSNNILSDFLKNRVGYMTFDGTYLDSLMSQNFSKKRANAKTSDTSRRKYYRISDGKTGIAAPLTKMPLVSFVENQLLLAEASARTGNFSGGVNYLNIVRQFLRSGKAFQKIAASDQLKYDDYVDADFETGGIENADHLSKETALLREIVEERYVSLYGSYVPFWDANRLRKSDPDLVVPFPLNSPTATAYPQRLLYPLGEINNNANVPEVRDIFVALPINK